MIRVKFNGRLGNQMFQYAFARMIYEIDAQPLIFDFKEVNRGNSEHGWENSLKYFNVLKYETYQGKIPFQFWKATPTEICKIMNYYRKYSKFNNIKDIYDIQIKEIEPLAKCGIFWLSNGYYPFVLDKDKYFLNGSFEDVRYFDSIKPILIEEFTPKNPPLNRNLGLLEEIESSNSVCISIRSFSEIESDTEKKSLYDVMNPDYYQNAMVEMKKMHPDAKFFVFSDDLEWVKKNVKLDDFDYKLEPETNPVFEKIRLMYSCKHFIIPNSTFSWWAQYLSRNENKTVISPKKWFNAEFQPGLIDDQWIKL